MSEWMSSGDSKGVTCSSCQQRIELGVFFDHHNGVCPHCGDTSVFLLWNNWTQIIPEKAPPYMKGFFDWAQKDLDELEFTELIAFFENLVENEKHIEEQLSFSSVLFGYLEFLELYSQLTKKIMLRSMTPT